MKKILEIAVGLFILYLGIHYWPLAEKLLVLTAGAARPLIIGGVIAYVVNLLMSFLEAQMDRRGILQSGRRKTVRRAVSVLLSYLIFAAAIVLILRQVVPELLSCVEVLITRLPGEMEQLAENEYVRSLQPELAARFSAMDWESTFRQGADYLAKHAAVITSGTLSAVSGIFSGAVTFVIGLFFSVYILADKEHLLRQVDLLTEHFLPEPVKRRLDHMMSVLHKNFRNFVTGQFTETMILGCLCTLGMMILRLPYAVMIGVLIGFTALIPVAGAYIGGMVGALMILTVSPVKMLLFLLFLVVLQQLEGNLIYPRVVGSSIGLPAIWVFAAVTVGGGIGGIFGMLLGVPLFATVYGLIHEEVARDV